MRSEANLASGPAPGVDTVRAAPKALLHDHLDGGLRPSTIVELAASARYGGLPTNDPEALRRWFIGEANSHDLLRYLATFAHTTAVTQTKEGLARVAAEAVADFDADGVVYAETRFAPEQHLGSGLSLDEAVVAVLDGLREGERAASGRVKAGLIVCAMRHASRSLEIAELAVRHRERGVVGFDIAGAEVGFPPIAHLEAFELLSQNGMPSTVHAGEWLGPKPFEQALRRCGAWRIGHGISIAAEIDGRGAEPGARALGGLPGFVRDRRVPLEVCPTSNLQTGGASSYATHPFGLLDRLGFCVTVNTDNRLMSDTTASAEFLHLAAAFGYGLPDLWRFTQNAIDGAFLSYPERERLKGEAAERYRALGAIRLEGARAKKGGRAGLQKQYKHGRRGCHRAKRNVGCGARGALGCCWLLWARQYEACAQSRSNAALVGVVWRPIKCAFFLRCPTEDDAPLQKVVIKRPPLLDVLKQCAPHYF